MKKSLFFLIFMLIFPSFAFAEGELSENPSPQNEITEDSVLEEPAEEFSINLVNLYVFGNGVELSSFPVFENETLMLPIKEFLSHLGANDFSIDSKNQITVTYGENILALYLGSTKAFLNGEEIDLPVSPFYVGDIIYAPAELVVKSLGFTFISEISDTSMYVYADLPANELSSEKRVNSMNLTSDTPYLIWVNKATYTVYVFLGKNGEWREVYSCKCSIGAVNSPTITGVFKYISHENKWFYDDFYVGPIMRFHRGFAIHSTLLKFDGSDYNNTVGVKNSHGCVRVRPENIDWLVSYVPLKTTIYVSEN